MLLFEAIVLPILLREPLDTHRFNWTPTVEEKTHASMGSLLRPSTVVGACIIPHRYSAHEALSIDRVRLSFKANGEDDSMDLNHPANY